MDDRELLSFEDSLEDTDYGLIVCGSTGKLKGLWMPKDVNEDDVPETIINICVDYFGIDPEEFYQEDTIGDPPTRSIH